MSLSEAIIANLGERIERLERESRLRVTKLERELEYHKNLLKSMSSDDGNLYDRFRRGYRRPLLEDIDIERRARGEYCRHGSPTCLCLVGWPYELMCSRCRDERDPWDNQDYCLCRGGTDT